MIRLFRREKIGRHFELGDFREQDIALGARSKLTGAIQTLLNRTGKSLFESIGFVVLLRHGQVSIRWNIEHADTPRLLFRWQERNGPAVSPPTRRGFGSQLIERALGLELKGKVRIIYDPAGVICEIVAPLSAEWEEASQT